MPRVANLVACSLAALAFAAPAALADPPDQSVTLSGTLDRTHVDTIAHGTRPVDILSTPQGPRVVTFAPGQPVPPDGADLTVQGQIDGDALAVAQFDVTGPNLAIPGGPQADEGTPLASGTPRTVAIVVITFGNGNTPAFSDAALQGVLVSNPNSVSNYFAEQSYGAVTFTGRNNPNGDVYHATIAASPDSGCANFATWGSQATAVVGASTLNQYDHVVFVVESGGACGWAGLGYMPGRVVYIDHYFQLSVVAHELGHNLGVHHASSLRCTQSGTNVAYSTVSGACSSSEYGDPFDIMGSSASNEQNAFHKLQSGWLGGINGGRVQTITATGDYTVGPLESSSGTALLLIPNVTGGVLGQDFALDFRQPTGSYFDAYAAGSSAVGGVQIRLVQSPSTISSPIQTQLIDANPATSTFSDAALASGQTFTDGTDQITVQTTSVSAFGATVHVTIGSTGGGATVDTTPPTAVTGLSTIVSSGPAVTVSFGPASDLGGVASYRVARDGVTLATLGSAATSYVDWTAAPGVHTYTVGATDIAGNVGPMVAVLATVPAPVVVTPITTTPTTPTTTTKPTGTTPSTGTDDSDPSDDGGMVKIYKQIRLAKGVSARVLARHGRTRRVEVTWTRVAGTHTYTVLRNGIRVGTSKTRTFVDPKAPAGTLRYTVRIA